MKSKCAKCGKERELRNYEVRILTPSGREVRTVVWPLCDPCAKSGFAPLYWFGIISLALLGLAVLWGGVDAMIQDGFAAGLGGLLFGLAFLAGAGWILKSLVWSKPTAASGLLAASKSFAQDLTGQGFDAVASTVAGNVVLRQELAPEPRPAPSVAETGVMIADIDLIRQYTHYVAQQWWQTQTADSAICDPCNGRVDRGEGYIVGQSLYCADCGDEWFGEKGLRHLRQDPDFFGRGLLQKAREFALNRQPA